MLWVLASDYGAEEQGETQELEIKSPKQLGYRAKDGPNGCRNCHSQGP